VNEPAAILEAFRPYHRTAELADVSDPNQIHQLQNKLDAARIYDEAEIAAFTRAFYNPKVRQRDLQAHIAPAVDRFRARWKSAADARDKKALDELDIFRKDLATFERLYDFLSQIINYGDTALESRAIFFRHLMPLLKTENLSDPIDLSAVQLTHYRLRHQGMSDLPLSAGGETEKLKPASAAGSAAPHDPQKALLSQIIARMNEIFEGELTDADLLNYATHVRDRMLENTVLEKQASINTKEQFALGDFQTALLGAVVAGLDSYQDMARQVLSSENVREGFAAVVLDLVYDAFKNRQANSPDSGDSPLEAY